MDPRIEVELARRFLVDGWMSVPGRDIAAERPNHWGVRLNGGRDAVSQDWQTLPDRILAAAPHLQGISGHERRLDELRAQGMPLLEALEIIDREFG